MKNSTTKIPMKTKLKELEYQNSIKFNSTKLGGGLSLTKLNYQLSRVIQTITDANFQTKSA
jgi:hypothetical protein